MFRKLPYIVLLLHAYVAWRLLPDLVGTSTLGAAATAVWLLVSALATPLWPLARRLRRQPLRDRLTAASMVALGAFSSLLALSLARDIALAVCVAAGAETAAAHVRVHGALAVPGLAALATLVGLRNARRRARIRHVDVPIDGLPAALHGFRIVQITDLHVGPTIKRPASSRP